MTASPVGQHRGLGRIVAFLLAVFCAWLWVSQAARKAASRYRRPPSVVVPGGPFDCGRWHVSAHSRACYLVRYGHLSIES